MGMSSLLVWWLFVGWCVWLCCGGSRSGAVFGCVFVGSVSGVGVCGCLCWWLSLVLVFGSVCFSGSLQYWSLILWFSCAGGFSSMFLCWWFPSVFSGSLVFGGSLTFSCWWFLQCQFSSSLVFFSVRSLVLCSFRCSCISGILQCKFSNSVL